MTFIKIALLLAATSVAAPLLAQKSADIPDLMGKWVGKNRAIVAGDGGHWPKSTGTFAKPLIGEKDVTTEITGQDGTSFWGVNTLTGKGQKTVEPFIGQLTGPDKRRLLMADTDGYTFGQLVDNDTMSYCYAHSGGKTKSSVVSCLDLKRSR